MISDNSRCIPPSAVPQYAEQAPVPHGNAELPNYVIRRVYWLIVFATAEEKLSFFFQIPIK